ncbi:MAG TPA: pyridoxamine 5'-phosphate oxidase family protein [Acidobacteriota bacterium]|nr:pyridoxamine 5'-phosphate oxidase family protein [Acidobacteriota bacterium]
MLCATVIVTWTVLGLTLGSTFGLPAENRVVSEPDSQAVLAAAREIVQKVRFCGLVTVDGVGQPQVRAMDPFPPDKDWNVVLATHRTTRKVEQIRNHPQVTLYYFDPDSPGYVTLVGRARLVDDQQMRESHWKDEWKDFYESENRGNDYLLIEVTPLRLEVVSMAHGIAADPKSWKPAIVEFGN